MSNIPLIQRYGNAILTPNITCVRTKFSFDFEVDFSGSTDDLIIDFIKSTLLETASKDRIKIIHKMIPEKGLSWHIDDCQAVAMKEPPKFKKECYIRLVDFVPDCNPNKYLYFNPDTPTGEMAKYTVLFYSSSHGDDFDGGILHLADGEKITPIKGTGFLVDTREAHMVTPITRGVRKVSVVKIY